MENIFYMAISNKDCTEAKMVHIDAPSAWNRSTIKTVIWHLGKLSVEDYKKVICNGDLILTFWNSLNAQPTIKMISGWNKEKDFAPTTILDITKIPADIGITKFTDQYHTHTQASYIMTGTGFYSVDMNPINFTIHHYRNREIWQKLEVTI